MFQCLRSELLSAFLGSAIQVLNPDKGQIQVAFCEGQGGATASTNKEWKQSWFAPLYAAEHGLLLVDVEPYVVGYIHFGHSSKTIYLIPHFSLRMISAPIGVWIVHFE